MRHPGYTVDIGVLSLQPNGQDKLKKLFKIKLFVLNVFSTDKRSEAISKKYEFNSVGKGSLFRTINVM